MYTNYMALKSKWPANQSHSAGLSVKGVGGERGIIFVISYWAGFQSSLPVRFAHILSVSTLNDQATPVNVLAQKGLFGRDKLSGEKGITNVIPEMGG